MNAFQRSDNGLKVGSGHLGNYGNQTGTVRQVVSDGDTIQIGLSDNLDVRLLGIDSAEARARIPDSGKMEYLKNEAWEAFFTSGNWRLGLTLHPGLQLDLDVRISSGQDVAANHARHAEYAHRTLERLILEDIEKSGRPAGDYTFFMAFAHEFMDNAGQVLCFLHSGRENFDDPELRDSLTTLSYNERLLATGAVYPFFVWPNVQPFLTGQPFLPEHAEPVSFWKTVQESPRLKKSRAAVQTARLSGQGVFDPQDPLRLAPFELRYICRRKPPTRYVVDLSRPGSKNLLAPELYYTVPNPEDRLFVPEDYRANFESMGWIVAETENSEAVG
ncbi:MAG: hypothetical protein EP344_03025 [Bacteroidetes bacterium]|nr:MAG: hypothetical protein EP344_03025 [Bacteroidota bacterium]